MKKLIFLIVLLFAADAFALDPGLVRIRETDGSPIGWVKQITVTNGSLAVSGSDATLTVGGSGQAITLDIGDDGGDDSVDIGEIATTGDTNSIVTEPSADKMLIDMGQNWPTADSADAVAADAVTDLGIDWGTGENQVSGADVPLDATGFSGNLSGTDTDVQTAMATIDAMSTSLSANDVEESHLKAVDAAADEDIFTYESTTGDFEWHSLAEVKAAMSLDNVENTALSTWAGSANLNTFGADSVTAAHLSDTLTYESTTSADFSGVTATASQDYGLAVPAWANVTPTSDKPWITWDSTNSAIKIYDGGWLTFATAAAPLDATYIVQQSDATLTNEQALGALASGILYSTTSTGVITIATEAQMETTLGIAFGTSKTATDDYILVGDGTDFESVAVSGDVTMNNGAVTIAANSVALSTDTTGNYLATLADDGTGAFTVTGSGSEGATVTLAMADYDHGQVSWTSQAATVEDFTLNTDAVVGDDNTVTWGADDWTQAYDETTDNRLEFLHKGGADADVYFDLQDTAADATFQIANSNGTYDVNLNLDGDLLLQNGSVLRIDSTTVSHEFNIQAYDTDGTAWVDVLTITNGTDPGITMGNLHFADTDASPDSVGELLYDNTVTGLDDGGLAWYDDDEIKYVASYETLPVDNGYQLTYNATTDKLYWAAAGGAGSTAWDDITDPDNSAETTVTFDNGEYTTFTSNIDNGDIIIIESTDADLAADTTLLSLQVTDDGDANAVFLEAVDAIGGTPNVVYELSGDGNVIQDGSITAAGDLATGGAALGAGDVYHRLGDAAGSDLFVIEDSGGTDQLTVDSDGAVIALGLITTGVGIDGNGAVDMDYGSADVTDHTFVTDGTGDGEIVLPNDSIGPAEMASGAYDLGTSLEADTLTEGGTGVPNTGDNLSVFAATTSAQLYGVISDETGSGAGSPLLVFNQAPTIDSPTFTTAFTATGLIQEPDLDSTNAPTDNYLLSYNAAGTNFTWVSATSGGTMTTVEDGDVQVGGSDIVTLDFDGTDFAVTESPDTEINIAIADIFLLNSGDVGTGTYDFGGASVELPNSTSDMTIGTEGQVGLESTDDQLVFHGGTAGEIQGEAAKFLGEKITMVFDPSDAYDQESTYRALPLPPLGDDAPEGITIVEWNVNYVGGDPTTELDADLMCDTTPDYNPAAGATVMDVLDTTAGASNADTGFDSATCANGSNMYIRFGADPTDANVMIEFTLWYYAEAD